MYHLDEQFIAVFGGFGKAKALLDYHLLDVEKGTIEKKNRFSEVGMEMGFKRVQKLPNKDFIFSSDANSEIYRVTGDDKHFFNDFVFDFAKSAEEIDYEHEDLNDN